jgi:hypothetical protein
VDSVFGNLFLDEIVVREEFEPAGRISGFPAIQVFVFAGNSGPSPDFWRLTRRGGV